MFQYEVRKIIPQLSSDTPSYLELCEIIVFLAFLRSKVHVVDCNFYYKKVLFHLIFLGHVAQN